MTPPLPVVHHLSRLTRYWIVASVAVLAFRGSVPLAAQAAQQASSGSARPMAVDPRAIDAYVEAAMREWHVPGVAIAVVRNDSVVYAKGYGVRELGKSDPVTPHSLFAIGSTSKAFTAAALGILVDEGKVRWDDPVSKYLPSFQLYDPYVTRELTIRDLLTHRSGLSRGDRLWAASGYDRAEVLRRVRYLRPSWSFRSTYGYQNIMFLAAGEVVAAVSGKSWDDFVRERFFSPLGMARTVTSTRPLARMTDVSAPHERISGTVRPVPWLNIDNIGPAGSINSSVLDMAEWIRLQLGQGTYEGRKLLEAKTLKEMHTPQTIIRMSEEQERMFPMTNFTAYGLAWSLRDYHGRKLVGHGGGIRGMRAEVMLVPEERLGFVVLTNSGTNLPVAIMYRLVDTYVGTPQRDWSTILLATAKRMQDRAAEERRKLEAARATGTTPSLALDKYAGTYADTMYGEVKIAVENGKLIATLGPEYVGELRHWQHDTFEAQWREPSLGRAFITFALDPRGNVKTLEIENLAAFGRVVADSATVRR
jgi:CubicO group peptidase (beta-lactamase class C family)